MSEIYLDVDTAVNVAVNIMPLIDDTDFKTRETGIVYNQAGMDLVWNFVTSAGVQTQTAVTPTTAGDYDWTHVGDGMYKIEIPASGGASINNDTEGYGWFTGICTGVLPWRSPIYCFRAAALNDALCDGGDILDVNVTQWVATAVTTPGVSGTPEVNVTFWQDTATTNSATTAKPEVDAKSISDSATAADNVEANIGNLDEAISTSSPVLLQSTTIATLASQTSFTLTAGSSDDSAYTDSMVIVTDSVTAAQKAIGLVLSYVGSTKTITLLSDPGIFTMAVGDTVDIIAIPKQFGAFADLGNGADIAGNLLDVYNRMGPPAGVSVSADIATVDANVDTILASLPTNFVDLAITASTGRVDIGSWLGTAVTNSSTTNKPEVDMFSIGDSQLAATNTRQSALSIVTGTVEADGSNSSTSFKVDATLGAKAANYFGNDSGGLVLAFVDGTTNEFQTRRVTAFNTTTDFITVEEAFSATPTASDAFVLLGRITELS